MTTNHAPTPSTPTLARRRFRRAKANRFRRGSTTYFYGCDTLNDYTGRRYFGFFFTFFNT